MKYSTVLAQPSRGDDSVAIPPFEQASQAAQLFKVLGDPTRLHILFILAANRDRPICSIALSEMLRVSPPTVTHHMKKLTDANLVSRTKVGKWAYYEIHTPEFQRIEHLLAASETSL